VPEVAGSPELPVIPNLTELVSVRTIPTFPELLIRIDSEPPVFNIIESVALKYISAPAIFPVDKSTTPANDACSFPYNLILAPLPSLSAPPPAKLNCALSEPSEVFVEITPLPSNNTSPAKVALADIAIASVVNLILLLVLPKCCIYSATYKVLLIITVPGIDILLPEKVTGELPNVTEVPDPDHPAIEPPVREPLKTDELSIFSH